MKRKIAAGIVRLRLWILIAMLILAALSAGMIGRTRINYDLTVYLSDATMTRRALTVMQEEFGSSEQLRVMFRDLSGEALENCVQALNDLDEVRIAAHDPETDVEADGGVCQLVSLTLNDCDAAALVEKVRGMFPDIGAYWVGGSAASSMDMQRSVGAEIPLVMLIALAVVLIVLLLTSRAWLEPVIILIVLAISILINMGTNFIFPNVSFITFAVCAILQLALSIDYAIMLLHTYNDLDDGARAPAEAMTEALTQCFMRIASSAMTTMAGLLSLLFMSFTIGFDIGLVLSKGIVISMLGVFLMMPAVTLLLHKPLRLTAHRPLRLGGEHLGRGLYAARVPVAICLVAAVIAGFALQSGNSYTFTDAGNTAKSGENAAVERVFGASNPLALLVPGGDEDADYDRQRALVDALTDLEINGQPLVKDVTAMVTTGAAALQYYTVQDAASLTGLNPLTIRLFYAANGFGTSARADRLLAAAAELAAGNETIKALGATLAAAQSAFNGPHYARLLIDLNVPVSDARLRPAIDLILATVREHYGEDIYLTGLPMSCYDIGSAFEGDLMKVNLITLIAIFLIVALSFRAVVLPALLVFVIEGAIWITMGLSRAFDQSIFFMSYLICVSIQMGATIDYGILLCDQYRVLRRSESAREALCGALKRALPTILTSGIILITAGYIIGRVCTIYYISSIGLLLSRGASISVLLVLTLLPALLSLFDRWVIRKKG